MVAGVVLVAVPAGVLVLCAVLTTTVKLKLIAAAKVAAVFKMVVPAMLM